MSPELTGSGTLLKRPDTAVDNHHAYREEQDVDADHLRADAGIRLVEVPSGVAVIATDFPNIIPICDI